MAKKPTYEELEQFVKELEKEVVQHKLAQNVGGAQESLHLETQFFKSILNSLSANIAILDQNGVIAETNQAWRNFAIANQIRIPADTIGVNYLEICDNVKGDSSEGAKVTAEAIRALIARERDEFIVDYACHSPDEKRWFYMRVTPLAEVKGRYVVVTHEDITALKNIEETLRKNEIELELKAKSLEDTNIALKVLLKQNERDKRELEEMVLINIKRQILPSIEKLKKMGPNSRQRTYLEILESNVNDIASPLLRQLSSKYINLTPQEIQVATFVKDGKTTKEIAEIMNISPHSVHFHRKRIRKKLGLHEKKANLRSHLLFLE